VSYTGTVAGLSKKTLIVAGVVVAGVLVLSAFARGGDAGTSGGSGDCSFTVSADVLNVRAGPSEQSTVVGELHSGQQIAALPTAKNGYRKLSDSRWTSRKFLDPSPGAC
jgi:uncharacterized protein YgiM (DUF1202 family)